MSRMKFGIGVVLAGVLALPLVAEGSMKTPAESVAARQAFMKSMGAQVGILGGMAQGKVEYDAAAAQAAADQLAEIASHIDNPGNWVEGGNHDAFPDSMAKASIWDDLDDLTAKMTALKDGTLVMQGAAGQGLEALQGAMGAVFPACGACHEANRIPKN